MKRLFLFVLVICLLMFPTIANAHPGRTDSNGGHTCRTNCEEWGLENGEYHFHDGGPPEGEEPVPEEPQPDIPEPDEDIPEPEEDAPDLDEEAPEPKEEKPAPREPEQKETERDKGAPEQEEPEAEAAEEPTWQEIVASLFVLGLVGGGVYWAVKAISKKSGKND